MDFRYFRVSARKKGGTPPTATQLLAGKPYDARYFEKHFSSPIYRSYVGVRNRFIKKEILRLVPTGKFLEIGFGGDNLLRILKGDFDLYGVDISEYALAQIVKSFDHTHFKLANLDQEKIPFSERFDVICAINTIEHLENPAFALSNIFDALAPGGIFALYLPTQSNVLSKILYERFYDVPEHVFRPSVEDLRKLLKKVGFKKAKEYAAFFIPAKISYPWVLGSTNLYLGLWQKR